MRTGIYGFGMTVLATLVCAAGVWAGGAGNGPATQVAAASATRDWDALVRGLGSKDFATREETQKTLEQVPRAEYGVLSQLAAATRDPEVQARLQVRMAVLEEEMAFDPAPISLKLTGARLPEARAALAQATGVVFAKPYSYQSDLDGVPRITVDLKETAFWDVVTKMGAECDLGVHLEGDFSLYASDRGGIRQGVKAGGFFAWAGPATRSKTIYYYREEGRQRVEESLVQRYYVVADPRICLIGSKRLRTVEARDDLNNVLCQQAKAPGPDFYEETGGPGWYADAYLAMKEPHGTKIASLRGEVEVFIGVGEQRVEAADIQTAGTVKIGAEEVVFRDVAVTAGPLGSLSFAAYQQKRPAPSGRDKALVFPVTIKLVDGAGRELWQGRRHYPNEPLQDVPITLPIRALLTAPAREKAVTVSFELKDLPLPY